jgi:hypothetical protein
MNLNTFLKIRIAICAFGVLCGLGILALVPIELIRLYRAGDMISFLLFATGFICCPVAMWLLGKLLIGDTLLSLKLRA